MKARKIYEWECTTESDMGFLQRLIGVDDTYVIQYEKHPGLWKDEICDGNKLEFLFIEDARRYIITYLAPKTVYYITVEDRLYRLHTFKQQEDRDNYIFGDCCIVSCNGEILTSFDSCSSKFTSYGYGHHVSYCLGEEKDIKKVFKQIVEGYEPTLREQYIIEQERLEAVEELKKCLTPWLENTIILDIIPKINNDPWLPKIPKVIRGDRYHVLNQLLKTVYEHEDEGNMHEANTVAKVLEAQHEEIENGEVTSHHKSWASTGGREVNTYVEKYKRKPVEVKNFCNQSITIRI